MGNETFFGGWPKKIYKKQANWLNDKTMVLNSICELS